MGSEQHFETEAMAWLPYNYVKVMIPFREVATTYCKLIYSIVSQITTGYFPDPKAQGRKDWEGSLTQRAFTKVFPLHRRQTCMGDAATWP